MMWEACVEMGEGISEIFPKVSYISEPEGSVER